MVFKKIKAQNYTEEDRKGRIIWGPVLCGLRDILGLL
jgi:hypothetical protein